VTRNFVLSSLSLLLATFGSAAVADAQPAPAPAVPAQPAPAPAVATPDAVDVPPSQFVERLRQEVGVAGGLTSEDVAAKAVTTSYALEASRAQVAAAAAEVDRAFAAYVPQVTLLGRYTRLSETDAGEFSVVAAPGYPAGPLPMDAELVNAPMQFETPVNNYVLKASITVPISDYFLRVSKGHTSAKRAEEASRRDLQSNELALAADAKGTYYSWARARLNAVVAEQALADSRAHLSDVNNALAAGTASRADVLQIEARVAESERLMQSTQNLVQELEEQIRILRHDPPTARYTIGEDLAAEPAGRLSSRHEELVKMALAQRPELDALRLRAESTERRASVERAGQAPRLDLFGNVQYENPSQRVFPQRDEFVGTWDAGAQLTWVLSDIPAASASAASFAANAAALRAERRATEDRIRQEVTAANTALLDARAAIETSKRGLAAAEESYRVRRVLFQNGRATSVELLETELALTRARLAAVAARIDLRVAQVRLDYAVGRRGGTPAQGG